MTSFGAGSTGKSPGSAYNSDSSGGSTYKPVPYTSHAWIPRHITYRIAKTEIVRLSLGAPRFQARVAPRRRPTGATQYSCSKFIEIRNQSFSDNNGGDKECTCGDGNELLEYAQIDRVEPIGHHQHVVSRTRLRRDK